MSTFYEPGPRDVPARDPGALVTSCIEGGKRTLLLDEGAFPPGFFDLSNGVAGELLHRLSMYGVRMAGVVPDPSRYSRPFQDFVREANRGSGGASFPRATRRSPGSKVSEAASAQDAVLHVVSAVF